MLPLNNRLYYCTQTILLHVSGRVRVWDKQDSYNSFENSRQVYSLDMLPIGSEHQHVYASNSDSANTRSLFRPLLSVSTVIVAQRYSRFWSYVRKARFYRSVRIILAPFSLHIWLGIRSWRSLVAEDLSSRNIPSNGGPQRGYGDTSSQSCAPCSFRRHQARMSS